MLGRWRQASSTQCQCQMRRDRGTWHKEKNNSPFCAGRSCDERWIYLMNDMMYAAGLHCSIALAVAHDTMKCLEVSNNRFTIASAGKWGHVSGFSTNTWRLELGCVVHLKKFEMHVDRLVVNARGKTKGKGTYQLDGPNVFDSILLVLAWR